MKLLKIKIQLSLVFLFIAGAIINAQVPKNIEPFIAPFGEFNFR